MSNTPATDALEKHFKQLAAIEGASSMLNWDALTMMPKNSGDVRAEQLAALGDIAHERMMDPRICDWLNRAGGETLEPWRAANLREMRHRHAHATAVPADLNNAFIRMSIKSENAWRDAKV